MALLKMLSFYANEINSKMRKKKTNQHHIYELKTIFEFIENGFYQNKFLIISLFLSFFFLDFLFCEQIPKAKQINSQKSRINRYFS